MTGLRCILLAIEVLLQGVVLGQQPARQPPPYSERAQTDEWKRLCTLEGRTIDATNGKTMSGVVLTLRLGGPSDTVRVVESISGSMGHFRFEYVTPGAYTLSAAFPGYASTSYGASSAFSYGTPLILPPGQEVANLELKLVRLGSISGKVVDEKGKGIWPAEIIAIPVFGRVDPELGAAQRGRTSGASGSFTIPNLAPGPYLLRAEQPDLPLRPPDGGGRGYLSRDVPRRNGAVRGAYYPSTTDPETATRLEVQAGKQLSNVKIRLPKRTGYTVSGEVVETQSHVANELLFVTLAPRHGQDTATSVPLARGATFVLRNVEPGSYAVSVRQQMTSQNRPLSRGWVPVEVTDHDVKDVKVPFRDFVRLSGIVRVEGRARADYGATSVDLSPVLSFGDREAVSPEPRLPAGRMGGRGPVGMNPRVRESMVLRPLRPETAVQDDGRFTIADIPPNTYSVGVVGLPQGTYVKSVRRDGKELVPPEIDLNQGTNEVRIEVVLGLGAALIEGTVVDAGAPAGGKWVTLIPATGSAIFKPAIAGETGRFGLSGVPPGSYRLYAWQELPYRALTDQAYLSRFSDRAVNMTLREGDRAQVKLTVIKAGDLGAK